MDLVNLPWPPVSLHINASCLSVFVKPRDRQLYVVIELVYTLDVDLLFFFE